jgi:hypothetical protein
MRMRQRYKTKLLDHHDRDEATMDIVSEEQCKCCDGNQGCRRFARIHSGTKPMPLQTLLISEALRQGFLFTIASTVCAEAAAVAAAAAAAAAAAVIGMTHLAKNCEECAMPSHRT